MSKRRKKRKQKKRILWNKEEDNILKEVVNKLKNSNGESNTWKIVSTEFNKNKNSSRFRNPKQCRERWNNHVKSVKNKSPWTYEEDRYIDKYVHSYGTKWTNLSKDLYFDLNLKRSSLQLRNRWNSNLKKNTDYLKNNEPKYSFLAIMENDDSDSDDNDNDNEYYKDDKYYEDGKYY